MGKENTFELERVAPEYVSDVGSRESSSITRCVAPINATFLG